MTQRKRKRVKEEEKVKEPTQGLFKAEDEEEEKGG